jgi:hypothetical protein
MGQLLQISFKDVTLSRGRFGLRDWGQFSERGFMEPHVLAPLEMGFEGNVSEKLLGFH